MSNFDAAIMSLMHSLLFDLSINSEINKRVLVVFSEGDTTYRESCILGFFSESKFSTLDTYHLLVCAHPMIDVLDDSPRR